MLQWKTNASSLGLHFRAGALDLIFGTKSAEQSCSRLSGVEGGGSLLTEARAIPRPVLATLVPSQGIVPNAQKPSFQGLVLGPPNLGAQTKVKSGPLLSSSAFNMFMHVGDASQ